MRITRATFDGEWTRDRLDLLKLPIAWNAAVPADVRQQGEDDRRAVRTAVEEAFEAHPEIAAVVIEAGEVTGFINEFGPDEDPNAPQLSWSVTWQTVYHYSATVKASTREEAIKKIKARLEADSSEAVGECDRADEADYDSLTASQEETA